MEQTHCAFKCTAFTSNFKLLAKLSHVIVHIFMLSFRFSAWKPRSWFALLKRLHSNRKENMKNTMHAMRDITLTGRYLLVFLETSFLSPWYNEWVLYWRLSHIRSKRKCEVLHLYFSIYTNLLWHIVLTISIDILKYTYQSSISFGVFFVVSIPSPLIELYRWSWCMTCTLPEIPFCIRY